ncbi:MAG: hypothetical protein IPJ61_15140 [Tessaracoccus sp.]|uniref:hypothetical protein n=1 Tax=Tessaracoccus sp. TaxID=1971211 RepID=UPI001ED0E96B|nr:hypothetical protein [Tessaracoccus sp.]MBK7822350.1 hypothetical protein [Tessaracoccus sp.]
MNAQRRFWTTWPGAVVMGLVSLAVALPGVLAAVLWLLVPHHDPSGIDFQPTAPSPVWSVIAVVVPILVLTLAALTVYWARRRWAGYVLLGVTANLVVGFVGLFVWGIL